MTDFANYFGLTERQAGRTSFELSPAGDADLYMDLDDVVDDIVLLLGSNPKIVLFGDFGTGKTHLLRHIESDFAPWKAVEPVYVELSGFGRRSTFFDVHVRVMSALLSLLTRTLPRVQNLGTFLEQQADLNDDVKLALNLLGKGELPAPDGAKVRAWLLGTGPTPTQARSIGFSGRLFESSGPSDLIKVWRAVGRVVREVEQKQLVLLVDEGEAFQNVVHPDAAVSMGAGLRALLDPDVSEVGCILALNLPRVRDGGKHPFFRVDVQSRTQGKTFNLKPLSSPERVRLFLQGLWAKISIGKPLLDSAALDLLSNNLERLRASISISPSGVVVSRTPTQRDLVLILTYIGNRAFREKAPLPITAAMLHQWFSMEPI